MALKPRKTWSRQLNWVVWNMQRRNRQRRLAGLSPLPDGDFPPISMTYYPEPEGGSTDLKRYQTNLDGQDDFWLRGVVWSAPTSVVTVVFIGPPTSGPTIYLFDAQDAGADRAFCLFNLNTASIRADGASMKLNGAAIGQSNASAVAGEINTLELTYATPRKIRVIGARLSHDEGFVGAILSLSIVDTTVAPANSFVYKLTGNAATERPVGDELPSSVDLTFQNGEPSGSDRELISRKADNSGWIGEGLNEYDYAAGSNP